MSDSRSPQQEEQQKRRVASFGPLLLRNATKCIFLWLKVKVKSLTIRCGAG